MKKFRQLVGFVFVAPLITALSVMPFFLLYRVSDLLFLILYYAVRYRRDVTARNLSIAFPELTEAERKKIERKFYRHLADIFVEMTKTFTISQKKLNKRFYLKNPEVLNDIFDSGKSVIVYGGHQGNWEWVFGVGRQMKHRPMAVYKKLSNPYFDRFVLKTRSKFNTDLVPTYRTRQYINEKEKAGEKTAYGFLGDQNPLPHKAKLWLPFFGKEVPVQTGAEEIAKQYDIPVVFVEIRKLKRGYYEAELTLITGKPNETGDFEITKDYFKRLEKSIKRQPEYYYWIHRRFKHARK
jgi:KDO2-lipid IV(A) lauroyltransferase